jgi:DUF4097 and DUF4098 domain-containing protein YvlB
VSVASAGRAAVAKTTSGNVGLTDITAEGDLNASSTSGNVHARDVTARGLVLTTISGNVTVSAATVERVQIRTMSGHAEYHGALMRGGRYELESHSGDVRLTMTGDTGFSVGAITFSGTVRSALPLPVTTGDTGRSGRADRSLRSVHGDGSGALELASFSGNIVIGGA